MSVFNSVTIRTLKYLRLNKIYDVFIQSSDKQIPLYYQYNQTRLAKSSLPAEDIIGYVTNIRVKGPDMVCDVYLDDMKSKASNFIGIIDNYTMKIIKDKDTKKDLNYEIVRFVVYDKDFKRKVCEKIGNTGESAGTRKPVHVNMHGNSSRRKHP